MFSLSMRRTALLASLFLLALIVALAPAAFAAEPARVKLVSCSVPGASAVVQGHMSGVEGAERMSMRFTLLTRSGIAGFQPVPAEGLGRWRNAKRGVRVFNYRQEVRGLVPNAIHRMRVDFRWRDSRRRVLRSSQRSSRVCPPLSSLPNLRARIFDATAAKPRGVTRYRVRLQNRGRAAAASVPVTLTVDGAVADSVVVPALAPGQSVDVGLRGPDCASAVRVDADPDGTILETSEKDNAQQLTCARLPGR